MNPRQLGVMAAIAAVLVALVLLTGKGDDKRRMQEIAPPTREAEFFRNVDPARIMEIRLEREGARSAVLKRTAGTSWTIETKRGPRPVRQTRADTLLGTKDSPEVRAGVRAIRQGEKEGSQASFGTDAANGTTVTFVDDAGREVESFVLGKRNTNASATCFVRKPDSEETYLLDVDLTDNFKFAKPSDFMDNIIFRKTTSADYDDIKIVWHDETSRTLKLTRIGEDPADMKWEYELDGRKGMSEGRVANRYAVTLSGLAITAFADDMPEGADELKPVATVTFRKKGVPDPITMEIAAPRAGDGWILTRLSAYPDVFGTTGSRHFLADPELVRPFDPEAMSGGGAPAE